MGGRLDAVNIVDADVAVVTSIGLDHTEWLGNDRAQVAVEKAGIARFGCPCVVAEWDPPASLKVCLDEIGAGIQRDLRCLADQIGGFQHTAFNDDLEARLVATDEFAGRDEFRADSFIAGHQAAIGKDHIDLIPAGFQDGGGIGDRGKALPSRALPTVTRYCPRTDRWEELGDMPRVRWSLAAVAQAGGTRCNAALTAVFAMLVLTTMWIGAAMPEAGAAAVPMAMLACVLADHYLRHRGQVG